jgi:NADPH:quinone reductase-like Zn-dependent oxidoreductase
VVGRVIAIGSAVTSDVKIGDRIAGFTAGGNLNNPEDGAFAEYAVVKDGNFMRVLDSISNAEAAMLPVGVVTNGMALYHTGLRLPILPAKVEKPIPILIYGGSSTMGALGIQYAKL